MMKPGDLRVALAAFVLAALGALVWACDDGAGGKGDGDSGTDADSDSDSDDCAPVSWGGPNDFADGMPVGNWVRLGFVDEDRDGYVEEAEQVEVSFSLEEIHCAGYESIVLMVGDTS